MTGRNQDATVHWHPEPGLASCRHVRGAEAIRRAVADGRLTTDPALVTCGSCRRTLTARRYERGEIPIIPTS